MVDTDRLIRWISRLSSTLTGSCVDPSTLVDPDWLLFQICRLRSTMIMCRFYRLKSSLIGSCVDSVEWDSHWLAPVSPLSTAINSFDWHRPWLAQVSSLSTLIDLDLLMCQLCRISWRLSWLARVSILTMVIDTEGLVFRFCRLWFTLSDTFAILGRLINLKAKQKFLESRLWIIKLKLLHDRYF